MKFKTPPFAHQLDVFKRSADAPVFALLMEQGTGKSKVVIDTMAHLYLEHKIDTVIIVAPNGVCPGWIKEQLPTHMSDEVMYRVGRWRAASKLSKTKERELRSIIAEPLCLRIFVMNVEAFGMTQDAIDFAIDVLDSAQSAMIVIDESQRIKTPSAHTTKRILNLRIRSTYRRILSGTPITNGPFDAFSQFAFLDPEILEVDSFTAFKAEYAELLDAKHGLMRHITSRVPKKWSGNYLDAAGEVTPNARDEDNLPNKKEYLPIYMPTIVATNSDGTPRYKNLERLQQLIAPVSYRVLKKDCLDLPGELYNRYYTELTTKQRAFYEQVQEELRIEWGDGNITPLNKLTMLLRLQQIVCGYIGAGEQIVNLFKKWDDNPRIASMLELIGDRPDGEGTIVWCRFTEDIRQVVAALTDTYGPTSVVQYHGKMKDAARVNAVERFRGERAIMDKKGNVLRIEPITDVRPRFMIAQPRAGGVGQNWVAGSCVIYYSNSFSLEDRLQSEDRAHRIGQIRTVQYIDIEAEDTIDERIITTLVAKKNVADLVTGDPKEKWLGTIE